MTGGTERVLGARERNRLSILGAAREVLAADPEASMDDVAAFAGMVRRTLYGHFPTRQDLIAALVRAGAREFIADLGPVDTGTADPGVELAAVVLRTWGAARRSAPVIELGRRSSGRALAEAMAPFNDVVALLIAHGQRLGVFGNDLDEGVLAQVMESAALTFLSEDLAGRWDGTPDDVALTHLLLLGMPAEDARAAVRQARTLQEFQ